MDPSNEKLMSEFEFRNETSLHSDVFIGEDGRWWLVVRGDQNADRSWIAASANGVRHLAAWR